MLDFGGFGSNDDDDDDGIVGVFLYFISYYVRIWHFGLFGVVWYACMCV